MAHATVKRQENIKLTFAGDLFPANQNYSIGIGIGSQYLKTNGGLWIEDLKKFFDDSDINFANLEAPLIYDNNKSDSVGFAGSSEFANFIKNIGINIVSVANNHILEQGSEGFYSTLNSLFREGIQYIGVRKNGRSNIILFQINNMKIGFAAFNDIPGKKDPGLIANFRLEDCLETIEEMKKKIADIIIISLHWGNEYVSIPSIKQLQIARLLIDKGVNIIVGHHPHVIQPVEVYKNGIIIYSLGNFIFDMLFSKRVRRGTICKIYIDEKKEISYEILYHEIDETFMPHKIEFNERGYNRFLYLAKHHPLFYTYYYSTNVKMNHIKSRILMKLYLLREWKKITPESKKILYNNILKKIKP